MKCLICLSPFESDEAYIPELECSCVFVTHYECWEEWEKVGNCLYCRPSYVIIQPPPPPNPSISRVVIFLVCAYWIIKSILYSIVRTYYMFSSHL